jgi:hypothetical protein
MIESATWTESGEAIKVVMDDGVVSFVPDDMANADRQALEQWAMVKGNMIQPYAPPPSPPEINPT